MDLLVARAPSLTATLGALAATLNTFALLDETVVRTDRLGGPNNRATAPAPTVTTASTSKDSPNPYGQLIWIFDWLPGSTHDLTATRTHALFTRVDQAGLHWYADTATSAATPTAPAMHRCG